MSELFAGWKEKAKEEEEEKVKEEPVESSPEATTQETKTVAPSEPTPPTPVQKLPTPIIEVAVKPDLGIKPILDSLGGGVEVAETTEAGETTEPTFGVIATLPEEEYVAKNVITVYGLKGDGKTTVALNFSGKILCISFDRKSMRIKPMVPNPERIKVYDLMKYVDYTDTEKYGRAMKIVFDESMKLLQNHEPVDWVVIDGADVLARIAEMVMRWKYGIGMTDGIKNWSVWKYRRFVLKQVHNAALSLAKKGVIYTTYVDKEQTMEGQQIIDSKDVPKWLDVIMMETDHVFRVKVEGGMYVLILESGKGIASQRKWDVTDKKVTEVIADFESAL